MKEAKKKKIYANVQRSKRGRNYVKPKKKKKKKNTNEKFRETGPIIKKGESISNPTKEEKGEKEARREGEKEGGRGKAAQVDSRRCRGLTPLRNSR